MAAIAANIEDPHNVFGVETLFLIQFNRQNMLQLLDAQVHQILEYLQNLN